ncbi:kelch repeat-containing protein [Candidatus Oscillochloris fontis]|uniref:Kelch repeat-containing protein n=1 Tax=Candidatus Oscillochloris fontis TaxID=2496868 RepID=UPI00101B6971|nr:kelch repeat-containing protein [Candidatus Oscillochloris fontis]
MTNESPISEREREILKLVATGASNQQIAQQLNISINTVKVHVRNIFSKTGVMSRTEATIYAINHGLVTPERFAPSSASSDAAPVAEVIEETRPPAPTPAAEPAEPATALAQSDPPEALQPTITPAQPPWLRLVGVAVLLLLVVGGLIIWANPSLAEPLAAAPTPIPVPSSDPNQRWFSRAPMPQPRAAFAITAYDLDRKLYVIGGSIDGQPSAAIDRFDPENNLWVSLTDKPTAVSHIGAAVLRGKIYVPGGIDATGQVRDILEIFDPREQRWHSGATLPAPRSNYALVAWEGQLYLIGGWDGNRVRSEVYIYDPQRDTWSEGTALPSPRQDAGATVVAGQIYVVGGSDGAVGLRETLELNPTEGEMRWQMKAPLPSPIANTGVVSAISMILVLDPVNKSIFEYNQMNDVWISVDVPEFVVISSRTTLLGSDFYIISEDSFGIMSGYKAIFTTYISPYR